MEQEQPNTPVEQQQTMIENGGDRGYRRNRSGRRKLYLPQWELPAIVEEEVITSSTGYYDSPFTLDGRHVRLRITGEPGFGY